MCGFHIFVHNSKTVAVNNLHSLDGHKQGVHFVKAVQVVLSDSFAIVHEDVKVTYIFLCKKSGYMCRWVRLESHTE